MSGNIINIILNSNIRTIGICKVTIEFLEFSKVTLVVVNIDAVVDAVVVVMDAVDTATATVEEFLV